MGTSCASNCAPRRLSGKTCEVSGGSSRNPTKLGSVLSRSTACTVFVLGDGYYEPTRITHSGITIRAANRCGARLLAQLEIRGSNVVVDGVFMNASETAITVHKPGVHVRNSCIQGFGRSTYGNGIWILQEALDTRNRIFIESNSLDKWGGYMHSGGIVIGRADDNFSSPSDVSVEVRGNRITGGAMTDGIYNAAVQAFHPFIAYNNYIHSVNGSAFQNKTFHSRIACNEVVNNQGDGALYNRLSGNNVWEYNIVHDFYMGIDHFTGDGNVFRGNIIYNTEYIGRIKNHWPGTTNLLISHNTFYNISGWAGWIWDMTAGGSLHNIVWRNNIFHSVNGDAIADELTDAWDEYANAFYQSRRPTRHDGAGQRVVGITLPSAPETTG